GGMPGCSNKEKASVPKPIKANLKPKPKMEVPGNKKLAGANPIFFTSADGRFAASAARATARSGDLGSGLVEMGYTICEIAIAPSSFSRAWRTSGKHRNRPCRQSPGRRPRPEILDGKDRSRQTSTSAPLSFEAGPKPLRVRAIPGGQALCSGR